MRQAGEEVGFLVHIETQSYAEREARSLVLRLLSRKVGELPEEVRSQIDVLSLHQLEALGEALLDFSNLSNLTDWLKQNRSIQQ